MSSRKLMPDVAGMLREGHFRERTANASGAAMPPADPVTVSQMVLHIDQIDPYDRNPRREANPRYAEIRDSIRAQGGLNSALEITRRPGAEHYMVRAGGNTRLQILKELHVETGDSCFAQVHCLFHPWTDDVAVLTAHLIENENELRGDMTLIDKALGVQSLRHEMEKDGKLSRNEFIRRLSAQGYTLSKRHIIRFEYATEVLYPLIPEALRSGMGQPQIDGLRSQCDAHRQYWVAAGQEGAAYDQMWADILSELDGPDFDAALVRQELEVRMGQTLGDPVTRIRLEVDATLSGKRLRGDTQEGGNGASVTPVAARETAYTQDQPTHDAEVSPLYPESHTVAQEAISGGQPSPEPPRTPPPTPSHSEESAGAEGVSSDADTALSPSPEPPFLSRTLAEQRRFSHSLAVKLADRHGLSGCVLHFDRGLGFLVDLPKSPLSEQNAEKATQRLVWWTLFSFSEFFADEERAYYMINHAMTPEHYLADGPRSREILGERPRIDVIGNQLSSPTLPDQDFDDLMALMRSCRLVRRHALPDASGDHLWRDIGDGESHDNTE